MSILESVVAGLAIAVITAVGTWTLRRIFRPEIRIVAAIEQGPTSRELGFTEPAVKITLTNKSGNEIRIRDIRLMFCGVFGAPVAPEAPPGRSHPELPASLASGALDHWHIPAEQLSSLLRSLHRPRHNTATAIHNLKLYARCITGTDKVYKSSSFLFSTDSDSHWTGPRR